MRNIIAVCFTSNRRECRRIFLTASKGCNDTRCRIVFWAWYAAGYLCTSQFQNGPFPPPPGQTPGHLTFLKNFGQIPHYIASLEGQMPHPLELQRGSNTPPSRHAKAAVETSSAKFSATTNFLFSLSSLHTLNKSIFHNKTI